jgi:hypothetical protein
LENYNERENCNVTLTMCTLTNFAFQKL